MRSVCVVVAVLSLLSSGHSAPVDNCGNLTQHLEIQTRDQLLGKWIAIAESSDIPAFKPLIEIFMESGWVNVTATNDSDILQSFQVMKSLGQCFTLKYNMTLKNSSLSIERPLRGSENLLKTSCPDCLIVNTIYYTGKISFRSLQLFSKRNKVSDAELEEYKKQVKCLNLPEPAVLKPEKGLCPGESLSQDMRDRDLSALMIERGPELFSNFESLSKNEDALSFLKLFFNSLVGEKEN